MATREPTDLKELDADQELESALARQERNREIEDLKWLLAHPQGRRFITRLLEITGVSRTSFNHSGSVMAFNEGRRDIGLFITAEMLEAAPEGYFKLLKEYQGK